MIIAALMLASASTYAEAKCSTATACPDRGEVMTALRAFHGDDAGFLLDADAQADSYRSVARMYIPHVDRPDCTQGAAPNQVTCAIEADWVAELGGSAACAPATSSTRGAHSQSCAGSRVRRVVDYVATFRQVGNQWIIESADYEVGKHSRSG